MAQKHHGMHVEDIKAVLRKHFGTLAAFSRSLGKNPNAASMTLSTPGYSVPTEIEIAKVVGRPPYEVWGAKRFHSDGNPVRFRVDRTPIALPCDAHRQNGVAA